MQGFFLATVLGLHRRNTQANHVLAIFIALLSLDLLQQIYYVEAFYKTHPQFIVVINLLPLTYGGFLFLYVRSLTQGTALRLRDTYHFAFFLLGLLVSTPFLFLPGNEKLILLEQMTDSNAPLIVRVFSLVMPLTATLYGFAAYFLLRRHSKTGAQKLSWLQIILGLNMVIWMVVWLSILAPRYLHQLNMTVIYLLVSLVIYMIGYFSLRQPDIFIRDKLIDVSTKPPEPKDAAPKYGDNRLPDELRENIWAALESYIHTHTPWRESNLTLAQLAENIGIASHHISQVLNDHHGLSFNDYLNQYRVNAVCAELQTSNNQNLLDIALACGFSSKSSFNAIFKKQTGKTPSEYRKDAQTL
jgi:AraC-like DNA-binding protein